MTAFTINGGATTNWDSLSGGSTNATLDSYAVSNNTILLIDTDSYQCAGHSAAFGSLDTVTFTGVGGKIRVSGQNVRVIPYTGGSGTVPAIGTTISQGGVSATLLGVWSSWQAEPLAAAAAMPATGYIKVKNKTGGNYAAGALTGITATAAGVDVVGWIEVRGADTATITVPRIGRFEVVGDWFELGTTNGTRGQILPCPTTATAIGTFPGVWIETAAGSGVYERFPCVGSMSQLATVATDERAKIAWSSTSGIRIGSDALNNVGFLPPTGCKVRIPNVIMTCCTRTAGSGSGPRVIPNGTPATRQEFITTSAGDIDLDHAVVQWYCNFAQPYRVKIRDSAINDTLVTSEMASPLDIDNLIIGPTTTVVAIPLNLTSNFAGGSVANVSAARFSLASSGSYVNVVNYCKGITFTNVKSQTLLNRGNVTSGAWTCTQSVDCTWNNCTNIGGKTLLVGCVRPTFNNLRYADQFSGTTGTTNAHYALEATTGTLGLTLDGVNFLSLTNVHPYNGLVSITACYETLIKNVGSHASPLSFGSANASGLILNSGGNNDTITLKRCYTSNTRTGLWVVVNSDNILITESVFGDYADTTVTAALNTTLKGGGMTSSTSGQISVYGTHWQDLFTSTTAGKVELLCNEPTATSSNQCTITSGTPKFNSSGQVLLTTIGDQVTWEMPYFAKGHTALANSAPVLTGTLTGNLTYQYQLDTGTGFGTLKTLNAANLSAETISPTTGFKLRIVATCATAAATNALTQIRVLTTTTSVAQSTNLYPLGTVSVTLTNLRNPSEIRVYLAGTTDEVIGTGAENVTTGEHVFTSDSGTPIDISILALGYQNTRLLSQYFSQDASIPISQVIDRQYQNG